MGAGRWTWPPVKHLGLASRCAGLWVVRASIPAPRTNGAQTMSTLSIKSRNTKSAAPKKGSAQSKTASRRKVTSPAANAKKPTRSVELKAERVAAAKTLRKADEPRAERVTKQERVLTMLSSIRRGQHRRNDAGDRLAAAQRARVPGGHGEKEARLFAHILEAQRGRSPLPHRNAARSLTWKNGRSMSQRRSCGSRR